MKELLSNSPPILVALQEKIQALTGQLQAAAAAAGTHQPRGFGALSSVVIDREIGNWNRFKIGGKWAVTPGYVLESTVAVTLGCKVA